MTDEQIKRINELAKKKKESGLTAAETEEQQRLRREYIDSFRESLRSQLESTVIVEPDGTRHRVTKKEN
ncbi:MAG: DUF896 domain-containing protein [Candidatus Faecivivens sp.]|nr:DUF896 domain-containing protein [Oscillospiraceae bacterium]MDY2713637.1 DUF896 domain-containing protein [Candidatus Faecivivens sp.]